MRVLILGLMVLVSFSSCIKEHATHRSLIRTEIHKGKTHSNKKGSSRLNKTNKACVNSYF
jgi:hypothetical protein